MEYKVVLIVLYDSDNRLLLQHRSGDAGLLAGYWAFFGGGVRDGETLQDALVREVFEEINYNIKSPQLILEQDFQEKDVKGHLYIFIEAFNQAKSILKLQEGQNWGWFKEPETAALKMVERDRKILKVITEYLENKNPRSFDEKS